MSILGLNKYVWTFGSLHKAQPVVPGFKPITTPRGYKPPKFLDAHFDRESGGYRVGTVRTWADGPHVKLRDGWFPYDPKTGYVRSESGHWVDLKQHSADVNPLHEHTKHILTRGSLGEASLALMDIQRNAGSKVPQEDKDKISHIYEGIKSFLEHAENDEHLSQRVRDEAEYLADELFHEFEDRISEISQENDPIEMGQLANDLNEHINDDLHALAERYAKVKSRESRGKIEPKVMMDLSQFPELEELTVPAKSMEPIGGQGNVSITQLRELEDGSKTVFKQDVLSAPMARFPRLDKDYGYARRETAAYVLNKLMGFDVVPPTVLVAEPVHNANLLDTELPKRYKWAGYDVAEIMDIDPDDPAEGSVQKYVEGSTLDELGAFPDNVNLEALYKILVLDNLMGNVDRHGANLMFDKDGNPWGIDHGVCFGTNTRPLMNQIEVSLEAMGEDPYRPPDSVMKQVIDVDEREVYDMLSGLIGGRDAQESHSRLVALKTDYKNRLKVRK